MTLRNAVPELLVYADLHGGERYEAWLTPEAHSRYTVFFLIGGVTINKHPASTEVAARKIFERLVEEKSK